MTSKTKLDVNLLLPDVPDASDDCYQRLRDLFEAKAGIEATHLIERRKDEAWQLCVHFASAVLSLQELRQSARQAGAELQKNWSPPGRHRPNTGAAGKAARI